MNLLWETDLITFVKLSNENGVKMLMVGGGAVNLHGYQRHSADVDFWVETTEENLEKLVIVLNQLGYDITELPESVKSGKQNISLKFSPASYYVELITHYSSYLTFEEAWENADIKTIHTDESTHFNVISLNHLIQTKLRSGRPKDFLDVQELQKIKEDLSRQ